MMTISFSTFLTLSLFHYTNFLLFHMHQSYLLIELTIKWSAGKSQYIYVIGPV